MGVSSDSRDVPFLRSPACGNRHYRWSDDAASVHPVDNATGYPEAEVEGFRLHMFVSYDDCGDALVTAPDGRAAGLVWETGEPAYVRTLIAPDALDDAGGRWGTYAVQQPLPMTTDDEAAAYLAALLPDLRDRWADWRDAL